MAKRQKERTAKRLARLLAFLPFCLLALANAGCLRLFARTAPEMPPLEVPAPPPRAVETADSEAPPPGTLVEAPTPSLPPGAVTAAASRPRGAVATTPKPDAAKVEPPKPEAGPVAELPPPEPPRPAAGTLQTAPPEREAELEKNIRELLGRADGTLSRIDYRKLNDDARLQYDQAKRFSEQAKDALRAKNLPYAFNLADKAATLAAQLAGR